jgi:hypothetical protein
VFGEEKQGGWARERAHLGSVGTMKNVWALSKWRKNAEHRGVKGDAKRRRKGIGSWILCFQLI